MVGLIFMYNFFFVIGVNLLYHLNSKILVIRTKLLSNSVASALSAYLTNTSLASLLKYNSKLLFVKKMIFKITLWCLNCTCSCMFHFVVRKIKSMLFNSVLKVLFQVLIFFYLLTWTTTSCKKLILRQGILIKPLCKMPG